MAIISNAHSAHVELEAVFRIISLGDKIFFFCILTAKKDEPKRGQSDKVSSTLALAFPVVRLLTSSQLDWTMLTH